jgi:KUP system potassium uptake protein
MGHRRDGDRDSHDRQGHVRGLAPLALGALGIVYGDIGTSPLYALRETFRGHGHELAVSEGNVLGVCSLAFWSLIAIISVKYLTFVMRADNDGEGGILALTSLLAPPRSGRRNTQWLLASVGLFGTALLYGDGMITPAISVLAAVEGTSVALPTLQEWVIPVAAAILIGLFAIQSRGTTAVGSLFGPVMLVWFGVLATLGVAHLVQEPSILRAVNPIYAVRFFADNGLPAFLSLGAVFLVVTGGEALYADMGHFGRRPIMLGWFTLVLPALLLNYFGQGALLLRTPDAITNPFYRLAPTWGVIPLVLLATAATVIASQALISGLYSLTMQAGQLDYAPRVRIKHTSATAFGQIFIPSVNWGLLAACVGLVVGFRSSAALAAAYGVAVTATMLITTVLFTVVVGQRFGWRPPRVVAFATVFGTIELGFFGANLFKVPHGGWFPLVVGTILFTMLTTWHTGRQLVRRRTRGTDVPMHQFLDDLFAEPKAPIPVPGTAVYLFSIPGATPPALVTNLRHYHVLHERVIVVSVAIDRVPRVPPAKRADVLECGHGVYSVVLRYGFMQDPNVPQGLTADSVLALGIDTEQATYFLSAEEPKVTELPGMAQWRERLFTFMQRNAASAANYFYLPSERVVIIGVPVPL